MLGQLARFVSQSSCRLDSSSSSGDEEDSNTTAKSGTPQPSYSYESEINDDLLRPRKRPFLARVTFGVPVPSNLSDSDADIPSDVSDSNNDSSHKQDDAIEQRGGCRHIKDIDRVIKMVNEAPTTISKWKCSPSCPNVNRKLGCMSVFLASPEHDSSVHSFVQNLKDNWYSRNSMRPEERIELLRGIAAPIAGGCQVYRGVQVCDKVLLYITGATVYGLRKARLPAIPDGRVAGGANGSRGEMAAVWIKNFALTYGCNSPTKENRWYLGVARIRESLYVEYNIHCNTIGASPVTIGYFAKIFSERYGLHGSSGLRICAKDATEIGKCHACYMHFSSQRVGTAVQRAQAKADWDVHLKEVRHGRGTYAAAIADAETAWAYLRQQQELLSTNSNAIQGILLKPGLLLSDASDAAGKWQWHLPKMPKGMSGVLCLGFVEFKITTVLQHGSGRKLFCISPPWVVQDSNLQTTLFHDIALPQMLSKFVDVGIVPPTKLHRQTDGGPDMKCSVQFTCNQGLCDKGIFPDGIDHDNLHSAHGHFDVDREHANLNGRVMRSGGAFSLRRLLDSINGTPGCSAIFVKSAWDYKRCFKDCKDPGAMYYRDPLNHRFDSNGYSARSCSYFQRPYEMKGRLFDQSKAAAHLHPASHWVLDGSDVMGAAKAAESFRSSIATIVKKIDGFSDATLHALGYPLGAEGKVKAKSEWMELWEASPNGHTELYPGLGTNEAALGPGLPPIYPHPVYAKVCELRGASAGPGIISPLPAPSANPNDSQTRVPSILPEHAAAMVLQQISIKSSVIKKGEWRIAWHTDPPNIFITKIMSLGERSNTPISGTLLESFDTPGDRKIRVQWFEPEVRADAYDAAEWLHALDDGKLVASGTSVDPPFPPAIGKWVSHGATSLLHGGEVGPLVKMTVDSKPRLRRSRQGDALYMAALYHLGGLGGVTAYTE